MVDRVDVSIIIPVGPGHELISDRAIASVEAQTVRCMPIVIADLDRRGAGWARNQALRKCVTPWFLPLDADDWLEMTSAETFLSASQGRMDKYVYSDWFEDERIVEAPAHPWCGGTWHVVSSLIPTAAAWRLGGFDETLPAMEDTDFYLKLTRNGVCPVHVGVPLLHYQLNPHGRSHEFRASEDLESVMQELTLRYGGNMGCCGDDTVQLPPTGERQASDVLAIAMWSGNSRKIGRATGRMYPRMSYPRAAWVDPRDVQAAPQEWRLAQQPTVGAMFAATPVAGRNVPQYGGNNSPRQFIPTPLPVPPAGPTPVKQDDRRVVAQGLAELANAAQASNSMPGVYQPPLVPADTREALKSAVERVKEMAAAKREEEIAPVQKLEPNSSENETGNEPAPRRKAGRPKKAI